jgi:predicted metal-binding membrane protein
MLTPRRTVDRVTLLTVGLLVLVTVAAWIEVIRQAGSMGPADTGAMDMPGMTMPGATMPGQMPATAPPIDPAGLVAFVGAWAVMMAAMMLPSALPLILLYRTAAAKQAPGGNPVSLTSFLVSGYLLVWVAFGVPVYVVTQVVDAVLASSMVLAPWTPYGVAAVLLVAGLYQFTALKRVCLRACQSPLGFLMRHWRSGRLGALRMGLEHGMYCCGCCWALMAVLVAAGAMGVTWVLLIAVVVAAEKLLPWGQWVPRATGLGLLGLGVVIALQPWLVLVLRGQAP